MGKPDEKENTIKREDSTKKRNAAERKNNTEKEDTLKRNQTVRYMPHGETEIINNEGKPITRQSGKYELGLMYYLKDFGFIKKEHADSPVPGFELDLYHPDIKVAIEYDTKVHSTAYHKRRDSERLLACELEGIRLIRIRCPGLSMRDRDDLEGLQSCDDFREPVSDMYNRLFEILKEYSELKNLPEVDTSKDRADIYNWIEKNYSAPTPHFGEENIQHCGQNCKVVGGFYNIYLLFQFDDGSLVRGRYMAFRHGELRPPVKDHLGIIYPSEAEKCKAYGISQAAYRKRKKRGWTEENALTVPIQTSHDPHELRMVTMLAGREDRKAKNFLQRRK